MLQPHGKFSEGFREHMRERLEFYRAAEAQGLRRELAVRSFEEINYEVNIESPASPEQIACLARQATEDCLITNTLKKGL